MNTPTHPVSIVFVHGMGGTLGTFALVEPILRARGHATVCVENPLQTLSGDVAATTAGMEAMLAEEGRPDGPVLLVGHSYGGAVITNVGRDPRVAGLVYIAAFAPAEGETVNQIVERYPAAAVSKYMRRGPDGSWRSERTEAYWAETAFDLDHAFRETISKERRESANDIFVEPGGRPAWADKPSWYVIADGDMTLVPQAQEDMSARAGSAVYRFPGSHYTPWTQPQQIAGIVLAAAEQVAARSRDRVAS